MQQGPPVLDALIIGQGLVGSLLGFCMIQNGLRVKVIDQGHQTSSTRVAAGLINPLLGKRLTLHDDFEHFYAVAKTLYQTIENKTECSFFETIDQLRAIDIDVSEKNWSDLHADPRRKKWTQPFGYQAPFDPEKYSVGKVLGTSIVDTGKFLQGVKQWLISQNSYEHSCVDVDTIDFKQPLVTLGQTKAKKIIYCEGAQAQKNPLWFDLPWTLAKGDILTLTSLPLIRQAYVWGGWLVPGRSDEFRLGSTFDWDLLNAAPNPQHRQKLLSNLKNAMPHLHDVKVVDHQSGIRPSTQSRQVFVGSHPKKSNALILNGMGSKGCLLAPHYAQQLTHWIIENKVPPVSVNHASD